MFTPEEPFRVSGNTITLIDENKQLLLVTPDRFKNILVSRYGVELSDWQPERRPGVKNVFLNELFKREKLYFFVNASGVEYQVDLKFADRPISEVKF
ncbi:hypothetical protein CWE15_07955 [Aliidiomarina taiwanensis]|uniref:Uncharacterized protein n=1 Tax=Aliidiomarina taiwanensis TaxID=946228 RepID=A0A432X1D0_9GAMM|nr:hypothetical protein [Aliidiomarina taiwanensis]RUO40072.1 hypothetical protein CWE15_07955 [Aliidiomarina taiwanensis]